MKRALLALAGASVLLGACSTTPVTGRKQLDLVSDAELVKMTKAAFEQMKGQYPIAKPSQYTDMVQRVGERIAQEVFWDVPLAEWEFVVFDNQEVNAFAMPGGKVGIFMGLFKIVKTEAELASVIAHEIAHVTAHHTHERLSQQNLMGMGGNVLAVATSVVSAGSPVYISPNSILGIYNIGTQGTVNSWDREKEAEADQIGLIYMARAGYDPNAAIAVMERMVEMEGATQPTYNSTHPSSVERLHALMAYIDEAEEEYEKAKEFHQF